ncbi:hypothetical protein BU16DRAFT_532508 [Lophium mytilinum]|uniref:RING-type domain-containing protein n=1 Tax=Lophium mytilinum TaxID=390894 RepID=A0A6A6RCC7_9PEZI|nr:hypothetical protein BU16DRAFT_532508 [Lophium mytilinum]
MYDFPIAYNSNIASRPDPAEKMPEKEDQAVDAPINPSNDDANDGAATTSSLEDEDEGCLICLEDYEDDAHTEQIQTTCCKRKIGSRCLARWTNRKTICPHCRDHFTLSNVLRVRLSRQDFKTSDPRVAYARYEDLPNDVKADMEDSVRLKGPMEVRRIEHGTIQHSQWMGFAYESSDHEWYPDNFDGEHYRVSLVEPLEQYRTKDGQPADPQLQCLFLEAHYRVNTFRLDDGTVGHFLRNLNRDNFDQLEKVEMQRLDYGDEGRLDVAKLAVILAKAKSFRSIRIYSMAVDDYLCEDPDYNVSKDPAIDAFTTTLAVAALPLLAAKDKALWENLVQVPKDFIPPRLRKPGHIDQPEDPTSIPRRLKAKLVLVGSIFAGQELKIKPTDEILQSVVREAQELARLLQEKRHALDREKNSEEEVSFEGSEHRTSEEMSGDDAEEESSEEESSEDENSEDDTSDEEDENDDKFLAETLTDKDNEFLLEELDHFLELLRTLEAQATTRASIETPLAATEDSSTNHDDRKRAAEEAFNIDASHGGDDSATKRKKIGLD